MESQAKARSYALGAVLLWSTVATAFKLSLRYLDVYQLLFWSGLVSTVVLGLVVATTRRRRLVGGLSARDLTLSARLGLLNPFLYYLVLFKAYDLLPAQEAQPLNYTWAITLALLSVPLLGQKLRAASVLALLVSYAGVLVITTRGEVTSLRISSPLGAGLALGSTVIWALYWIYNARDRLDPVLRLCLNFAFGTAYSLVVALLFSRPFAVDASGLLGAGYVGVFEMGITFVLWLQAMRLTRSAADVGNLIFLSPFLSLVLIHFVLGEEVRLATILGLVLIVAGITLQRWRGQPEGGTGAPEPAEE